MTMTEHHIDALLRFHRATFGGARMEDSAPIPTPAGPPAPTPPAPTYEPPASQADFDRIINERLARERGKFADYGELKAAKAKLDQIEAANATETEKAVKAAREEGKAEVQTAANARLVNAEVRALAAAAKFRDPTDAIAQLSSRLGDVKVGDDGEVDGAAVKTLLGELATAKPYLLTDETPPPPPPFNGGPRPSGTTPTDPRAADLAQIEADIQASKRR